MSGSTAVIAFVAVVVVSVLANDYQPCPAACSCLDSVVECSGAEALPNASFVPKWAKTLMIVNVKPTPSELTVNSFTSLGLRELRLTRCGYASIPNLGPSPHLKVFGMAHNQITVLDPDALRGARHLEGLDFEQNLINKLTAESLPRLPGLRSVRLSNNRINEIEAGAFTGLAELVDLRLNRNRIASLPRRLFDDQRRLENLDLSKNRLSEIDGLFFRSLESLTSLKLRHNKIKSFKDGAFYGLNSLTELRLDNNQISIASKTWTYGLGSLVTLSISHNRIATIDAGCWEGSENLQELDLSGNSIRYLNGQMFERLSNLRTLKLDGNEISSIAENAFVHMPSLDTLDLSRNRISWTVEDMNSPFLGLKRLHTFSLAHNHIKSIGDKAFITLESLNLLDMSGNNITSIQEKAFIPLVNLRSFHINTSSLLCDCDLRWFINRLTLLSHRDTVVCAYPLRLRGKRLLDLDIESLNCNDSPKPRIYEHPKSKLAIKGETARLHCKAVSSSSSRMEFVWRRNDINITNSIVKESVKESDDGMTRMSSELSLTNVSDSDSGKYQCIVSNSYGTTYSNKSLVTIVIFPKFIKTPANITVNAGETAKLECAAIGDPSPEIAWQKAGGNNFPAARERRMHMIPSDDVFFIVNAKTSDTGVYSCTAQNIAGSIMSSATLTVLEAPSFVNAMENKEITAGESVVIECMVSGFPKPSLRWLKDGAPIILTERHFFTAEEQLLIIVGAIPSDEGLYECEITNALGTVKDSTELKVLPPIATTASSSDDDMMGIIIITVVCCAVGTSIVWVFIIYHTRKRLNSALPQYSPDSLQLAPLSMDAELTNPHLFNSDNISERSSCKDSGTGDSAKRSSLEVNPSDELQQISNTSVVPVFIKPSHGLIDESRLLIKKDDNIKAYYSEDCEHNVTVHMPNEIQPDFNPGFGAPSTVSPQVQQWFLNVDSDRSGFITAKELQAALVNAQGNNFSDTACRLMIGMFDSDHTGTINLEEFDKLYNYVTQWLNVFHTYDRDESGHIEESELSQALSQMGFRFSPDFIKFLVVRSDLKEKSKVSVDQFIVLCVQIQRFTEAFRSRDSQQQGIINIGFEEFLSIALSCSI